MYGESAAGPSRDLRAGMVFMNISLPSARLSTVWYLKTDLINKP